jgi:hypothetical protein
MSVFLKRGVQQNRIQMKKVILLLPLSTSQHPAKPRERESQVAKTPGINR